MLIVVLFAVQWAKRIRISAAASLILAGLALVFFTYHLHGSYSWRLLMVNSHHPIPNPAEVQVQYGVRDYIRDLLVGLRSLPSSTQLFIWIAAGVAAFRLTRNTWTRYLLASTAIALALRFIAFPISQDRYFVWSYLVAGICLAETYFDRPGPLNATSQAYTQH